MSYVIIAVALALTAAEPSQKSPYGGREGPTFNITSFGAKGDNATLNTAAFVEAVGAIDKVGGGTLVIPDGCFITGPFNMTSHMTLFLTAGATLRAPTADQLGPGPAFPLWHVLTNNDTSYATLPRGPASTGDALPIHMRIMMLTCVVLLVFVRSLGQSSHQCRRTGRDATMLVQDALR